MTEPIDVRVWGASLPVVPTRALSRRADSPEERDSQRAVLPLARDVALRRAFAFDYLSAIETLEQIAHLCLATPSAQGGAIDSPTFRGELVRTFASVGPPSDAGTLRLDEPSLDVVAPIHFTARRCGEVRSVDVDDDLPPPTRVTRIWTWLSGRGPRAPRLRLSPWQRYDRVFPQSGVMVVVFEPAGSGTPRLVSRLLAELARAKSLHHLLGLAADAPFLLSLATTHALSLDQAAQVQALGAAHVRLGDAFDRYCATRLAAAGTSNESREV